MELKNPKGQRVLREERETSRFGVVACDWKIPESGASGEYRWQVEEVGTKIGVGRWRWRSGACGWRATSCLCFRCKLQRRRRFCGRMKKRRFRWRRSIYRERRRRGKVRVESVGAQGQVLAEGRANALGRFVARFRLPQGAGGQRFVDTKISVSYTDEQSGRTERQLLELRVSEKDLHLYVHAGAGEHLYVVVSSPAGTPRRPR